MNEFRRRFTKVELWVNNEGEFVLSMGDKDMAQFHLTLDRQSVLAFVDQAKELLGLKGGEAILNESIRRFIDELG